MSDSHVQVIQNHPGVPLEWKADTTYERSFAVFYNGHVQKGSYKMNAEDPVSRACVIVCVSVCVCLCS